MSSITDLLHTQEPRFAGDVRQSGFVLGVITENNDEDFPGMVKVSFTAWEDQKNICEWIPCLWRYAGDEYGCVCMPEVGEQVVVGFLGAGGKNPFVMGSLYPGGAKFIKESFEPAKGKGSEKILKRLRTRGGTEATLSDERGKQRLQITTPKALTLCMEDEKETITICDKKGENQLLLDCANGALKVTAQKSLTLQVGSCEVTLDGQKGAITLSGNLIELKAKQMIKLSAQQAVQVDAGMLQLQGKQTASLKGGVSTEVSGGVLKLN